MRRFRRFWSLPAADRRLLVALGIAVPLVDGALRLFGFGRVYRALRRSSSPSLGASVSPADVERYERLLRIACRQVPSSGRCLARSLTSWCLLRRKGLAAVLRIGTRARAGLLQGHAWIEYEGRVVNDSADVVSQYVHAALAFD